MYKKVLAAVLLLGIYGANAQTDAVYSETLIRSFSLGKDTIKFETPRQVLLQGIGRTGIITLGQIGGKDIGIQVELVKSYMYDTPGFISGKAFFQKENGEWKMIHSSFEQAEIKTITDSSNREQMDFWSSVGFPSIVDNGSVFEFQFRSGFYSFQQPVSKKNQQFTFRLQENLSPGSAVGQTDPIRMELEIRDFSFDGKTAGFNNPGRIVLEKIGCTEIMQLAEIGGRDFGVQFELIRSHLGNTPVFITGIAFFQKNEGKWETNGSAMYNRAEVVKVSDTASMMSKGFGFVFCETFWPPEAKSSTISFNRRFYFPESVPKDLRLYPGPSHEPE